MFCALQKSHIVLTFSECVFIYYWDLWVSFGFREFWKNCWRISNKIKKINFASLSLTNCWQLFHRDRWQLCIKKHRFIIPRPLAGFVLVKTKPQILVALQSFAYWLIWRFRWFSATLYHRVVDLWKRVLKDRVNGYRFRFKFSVRYKTLWWGKLWCVIYGFSGYLYFVIE